MNRPGNHKNAMPATPLELMEKALEVEARSLHTVHKVGALLRGQDTAKSNFEIGHPNFWPPALAGKFSASEKLGNASTTVHAEIAVLLNAPGTEGAELYITDLPCPNCAKSIAEARIGKVYIDSHAHHAPLGQKMEAYYNKISRPLLEFAGVNIYEIDRAARTVTPLAEISQGAVIPVEKPVEMSLLDKSDMNPAAFARMAERARSRLGPKEPFVACYARTRLGSYTALLVRPHLAIGLDEDRTAQLAPLLEKYSLTLQPIDRALITAARYGLKIDPAYLYSAHVPTAREFVNLVGAGYTQITIGDSASSRDEWGLQALGQLENRGILTVAPLRP